MRRFRNLRGVSRGSARDLVTFLQKTGLYSLIKTNSEAWKRILSAAEAGQKVYLKYLLSKCLLQS
jgi:hypothetical protein